MMEKKYYDRLNLSDFDKLLKQQLLERQDVESERTLRAGLLHAESMMDEIKPDPQKEIELIEKLRYATQQKGLGATGEIIH